MEGPIYRRPQPAGDCARALSRGVIGTNDDVLIGGFIVGTPGDTNPRVVRRAMGPSLQISGALQDPTMELYNGNGDTIATNDNWKINDQPGNRGRLRSGRRASRLVTTVNQLWWRTLLPTTTPRSCAARVTRPGLD